MKTIKELARERGVTYMHLFCWCIDNLKCHRPTLSSEDHIPNLIPGTEVVKQLEERWPADTRYVLHASRVVSKNDGQSHYIPADRLLELYSLDKSCNWIDATQLSYVEGHRDVHLWPNASGNYELPIGGAK